MVRKRMVIIFINKILQTFIEIFKIVGVEQKDSEDR